MRQRFFLHGQDFLVNLVIPECRPADADEVGLPFFQEGFRFGAVGNAAGQQDGKGRPFLAAADNSAKYPASV